MTRIMLWDYKPGGSVYDQLYMGISIRRLLLIVQVKVSEVMNWGSSHETGRETIFARDFFIALRPL